MTHKAFCAPVLLVAAMTLFCASARAQDWQARDIAPSAGFQDYFLGHFKRGRALVAADFDLDGRIDFYLGNPGDEAFVIRNTASPGGGPRFEFVQLLVTGELTWGGAAADYDNDGDYDLFITVGGNEGLGYDYLFRNLWMESGQTRLRFRDESVLAGIRGRPLEGGGFERLASSNAVWADYDGDADVDLFVNIGFQGGNLLWRNNGDRTFTDVTVQAGLDGPAATTQHSTFLDIDNDGDTDLYQNNFLAPNILWRNRLAETGTATFEDVTAAFSPEGEDISYPTKSFVSVSADFNNDGWQDLLVFQREVDPLNMPGVPEPGSPYAPGHALYLNQAGTGFLNVGHQAGLNNPYITELGVMGCQVGDITGDGVPDVYIGNGGPMSGPTGSQFDQLYFSDTMQGAVPIYVNRSELVDFPAAEPPPGAGRPPYPPYPYHTHGTAMVDVDNDGTLEIAVSNGGPASQPDIIREPNRLFRFTGPAFQWLKVRPVGDAENVSLDAIGTRMKVTVSRNGDTPWDVYQTLYAGSAFSAQSGFELFFGLKNADAIHALEITWPDGQSETITDGLALNSAFVVTRTP